jgi:hypothetical protein
MEPRTGRQVAQRRRHEDLTGSRGGHDPGADRDGDPADLAGDLLDLADVKPGPHLEAERLDGFADVEGALDGRGGGVEDGEEAVSRRIDLAATVTAQCRPNGLVMLLDEITPGAIAQLRRQLGRPDDVREEHGRQETLDPPSGHGQSVARDWGRIKAAPRSRLPGW